jgi:YD repeat-containing protein
MTNFLPAFAKEVKNQTTSSYSVTNMQGYSLDWKSVQDGKLLEKVTVGNVNYTYTYNSNKNRITKTSKKNTVT